MSLNRYAAKRDHSEPEIVNALRKAGFSVYRLDTPVDLLIGVPSRRPGQARRTYLAECKSGKAKLNSNQQDFLAGWRGAEVVVLRSAQCALDWAVQVASEMEAAVA